MCKTEITIEDFSKVEIGKIVAFFDCRIGPVKINGMKLIHTDKGPFVAVPSIKVQSQWVDMAQINRSERGVILAKALAKYNGRHYDESPGGTLPQHYYTPDGEDLGRHFTDTAADDIPY